VQHLGAEQGRLVVGHEDGCSTQRFDFFPSLDHLDQVNSTEGSSGMTQKRDEHPAATQTRDRDHLTGLSRQL